MSEGLFDKSIVAMECRTCHHRNLRTVGWARRHESTECDRCCIIFPIVKPDTGEPEPEVGRTLDHLRAQVRTRVIEPPAPRQKRRFFWGR